LTFINLSLHLMLETMSKVAPWCLLVVLLCACSVNWYDRETGTQHLVGFVYLKMRAVPREPGAMTNATMAYVTGTRNAGLQLGAGSEFAGLAAGWDSRSRITIKTENSHFSLLWPTNALWLPGGLKDFFNLYIGTNFPFQTQPQF
jgi:hypothetical protein